MDTAAELLLAGGARGEFFIEDTSGSGGRTFLMGPPCSGECELIRKLFRPRLLIQLQSNQPESGSSQILAGRYKLVKQLGRGGRGEVWLAVDEQTGDEHQTTPRELAGDAAALNDLTREGKRAAICPPKHHSHSRVGAA